MTRKPSATTGLPGSRVSPQESHLAVAAYSSPHIQSQLVTDHLHFRGRLATRVARHPRPCPTDAGVFEGDCRPAWKATHVAHWEAGLSIARSGLLAAPLALYCPPPGSFSRQRLAGNALSNIRMARQKDQTIYRGANPFYVARVCDLSSPATDAQTPDTIR